MRKRRRNLPSNQINGEGMGCKTICDLPDSLLTQILLNLPTKDSVKTSVLSTRWRNLWLSVPGLDLITYRFPCQKVFARFMDRFLEFNHHRSRLQKLEIRYEDFDGYQARLMELIDTVVDRGIQHLDVTMYLRKRDVSMHQNIYKSKTLVSLKLDNVGLKNPEFVVSLPCLKIMHLGTICYGKDGPLTIEKLISGCPLLEDLHLIRPFDILNEKVVLFLRVSSQTLKRCWLGFGGDPDFTVEIDTPRLHYMSLKRIPSDKIVVKNLSSLFMITFDLRFGSALEPEDLRMHDIFCDFLARISSVRRMKICEWTLKVLSCYLKVGPIPKFHNLYYLHADFYNSGLQQSLPAFLESCPNLKILSIGLFYRRANPTRLYQRASMLIIDPRVC